ncbi:MAG TPA: proton-conducting transporter membrane subunit [Bacteroidales bacterium]|nr:proton-conducting transporter membrane subunit [Bacteroidales bacterium]
MIGIYLSGSLIISLCFYFARNHLINVILAWAFIILQTALAVYEYNHPDITQLEYFTPDALAVIFLGVISIVCIPAFYHTFIYFTKHPYKPREQGLFYAAMVILTASISAAYLSNHLGITWVFVELTTLSASTLIYHRRNKLTLEGTWKYIFICSISITLVFIGILFVTVTVQQQGIDNLFYRNLSLHAPDLSPFWLKLAFLFIFTGFTAKAGLVPMYTAGIDAKDKAPYPAGALLASVLMNVGFIGIFRFYEITSHTVIYAWTNKIVLISAVLSVFVATVYMLRVKNIKRMMAYSGLEHMGIVMLGLASGGIGYYAAILHLILHSFAKPALFFQFGQIYRTYGSKSVYDVGQYFKYNITGAVVLMISYFIITAMPPSGMFVSEFLIFRSLFESGLLWVLILVMLLLTVIIWAFGKNVFKMLFIKPVNFDDSHVEPVPFSESLSQFILLALVIYVGLNPPAELVQLINSAISTLPR